MNLRLVSALPIAVLAVSLAGCGGGGGGGDDSPTTAPPVTPVPPVTPPVTPPVAPPVTPPTPGVVGFMQKANWIFTLPSAGANLCYDFDKQTEVADCTGKAWDLQVKSGGRTAELFTNSGVTSSGAGGAFGGPFTHTWDELLTWKDALIDPSSGVIPANLYFADSAENVFSGTNQIRSAAFEYAIGGESDRLLYPNQRVFLITTDGTSVSSVGTLTAPVYALQVTGYYGGPGSTTSGYPTIRWLDRLSAQIRTATIDASTDTVYFNLTTGTAVGETGDWHVAFKRNTMKLNGGASGTGKVAGFLGATPAGFYSADGKPVVQRFKTATPADTLADLTGVLAAPASANAWVKDAVASQLAPSFRGSYPGTLDFGWFTYYPTDAGAIAAGLGGAHQLKAQPARGALVRSGEGNSYARMHVTSITYAPVAPPAKPFSGAQTWTIEMDVQPAR